MARIYLGCTKESAEKDLMFRATIKKYLAIRGWKVSDLIRNTGITQATYYEYMRDPSKTRLVHARLIYDALRVPPEERGCC